jgi:hypothetical protein
MTWNDAQACHLADLAGSVYARGIEEAPGHVASARAEYRQISCAWHSCLGFALYLGGRASAHETALELKISSTSVGSTSKRKALYKISRNQGTSKRAYNVLDI